jgi:hypothetical protein
MFNEKNVMLRGIPPRRADQLTPLDIIVGRMITPLQYRHLSDSEVAQEMARLEARLNDPVYQRYTFLASDLFTDSDRQN